MSIRVIDDQIVVCLKQMDRLLNHCLDLLSRSYRHYVSDALIQYVYDSITPGGVRIFKGSRNKEKIKIKLIDVISHTGTDNFIPVLKEYGLARFVKEKIIEKFLLHAHTNYYNWSTLGTDPYVLYTRINTYFLLYSKMRETIKNITFEVLSEIVLKKYVNWSTQRSISSYTDTLVYEEDVQNSLFSIDKAIQLFIVGMHKSFFSYATRWIKVGITSSDFKLKKPKSKKENVCVIDIDSIQLAYSEKEESNTIKTEYLEGSCPIPNEIRVYYAITAA